MTTTSSRQDDSEEHCLHCSPTGLASLNITKKKQFIGGTYTGAG